MKQKVVLRLSLRGNCQKCRAEALKIAVSQPGVVSAALTGEERNQLEVVGEQIDVGALTKLLRKKLGHVELVSVGPAGGGYKEDEKACQYPVCRSEGQIPSLPIYTDQDKKNSCSVM